jgi:hypothetical protein
MFLVSCGKEFKDGHRGDLSRGMFIDTKQLINRRVDGLKGEHRTGVPRPQAFVGVCGHGGWSVLEN